MSTLKLYVTTLTSRSTLITEQSVQEYRLPPFRSLNISLTCMDNIKHRDSISDGVSKHGGATHKDIRKGVTTHLLCGGDGDDSSEKVRIARKYNETQARKGDEAKSIHIVWEEWFWDSVEFGGEARLNYYSLSDV